MKIDGKLVDHLAHLSRLSFDEAAKNEMIEDLNKILSFVEKLNQLDTEGLEPLIYMVQESNRTREDIHTQQISHSDALKNAPRHDSDYFRVPRFIEN